MISLMDASVSTETEVSPLPLRVEVPPSDARVAADRLGRLRDPWSETRTKHGFRKNPHYPHICCRATFA